MEQGSEITKCVDTKLTEDCGVFCSTFEDKANVSHLDDQSDDVFCQSEKVTFEASLQRKEVYLGDCTRKSRASERRKLRSNSSQRSAEHSPEHDGVSKFALFRAYAKWADIERQMKLSSGTEKLDLKHWPDRARSSSVRSTYSSSSAHKKNYSRRQSSFTERSWQRRKSHVNCSASLQNKPGTSVIRSHHMSSSDIAGQGGGTTDIVSYTQTNSPQRYSKPAMEVAVSALVFMCGLITLIVSLCIGSSAWTIVGSITMGIGGLFIGFGAYFYISRRAPLLGTPERLEIQLAECKQVAEMGYDDYKVDCVPHDNISMATITSKAQDPTIYVSGDND